MSQKKRNFISAGAVMLFVALKIGAAMADSIQIGDPLMLARIKHKVAKTAPLRP